MKLVVVMAFALFPTPIPPSPDSLQAAMGRESQVYSWLALGDSYTIGQSVGTADRYPVQAATLLKEEGLSFSDPEIIATTGWTTGDLLNALQIRSASPPPDIVSLLIGVNNQYQGRSLTEYRQEFSNLLRQSIQLAGNRPSHVIVLSIPDYSVTPFAKERDTGQIASQIDSFNSINYQLSSDYQVHYLDVTAESRKAAVDPSLIASDGLHFSPKEYAIWAELLKPFIKGIVAPRASGTRE
jgi:lysophospholipase L1-like esterase